VSLVFSLPFPLMANGGTRTQIRQIRRRFGWRVVFVQAVGEYLQLERADSARSNESKIVPLL
jgi:adenine/guanine phosphoribosyltransferase-like PRPP-binding protein